MDYKGMIVLHGDLFRFDQQRRYLIDQENKQNRYDLSVFERSGYYLKGLYDIRSHKVISSSEALIYATADKQPYPFKIPVAIVHKGERLSDRVINLINNDSLKWKHGFYYVDQALSDRLNGDLPTIDIYGTSFILNIKERELSQVDLPENKICFPHRAMFECSEIFYSTSRHTQVNVNSMVMFPNLKEFHPDVECILFPPLQEMDMIGYIQLSEMKATAMVCEIPWQPDQSKIRTMNLKDVDIASLLLKNLRQQPQVTRPDDIKQSAQQKEKQTEKYTRKNGNKRKLS
ncbi:hypothetical protein [Chitinophaga niabensis]|uniref:hypothetical protein n=1 Tax=Chitinophaga niabensis TaxID=536979 RepID=UPI0011611BD3|nr:hypothetical protein [Chitinophaga niabensis]